MLKVLKQQATAGNGDRKKGKNDCLVTVSPATSGSGITVNLQSPVLRQYGKYEKCCKHESTYSQTHCLVCQKLGGNKNNPLLFDI